MLTIHAMAVKPDARRKAVDRRRKELKGIRENIGKIFTDERKRASQLWDEHKKFMNNNDDDEEPKVVDVEIASVDDFFNGGEK